MQNCHIIFEVTNEAEDKAISAEREHCINFKVYWQCQFATFILKLTLVNVQNINLYEFSIELIKSLANVQVCEYDTIWILLVFDDKFYLLRIQISSIK